jgi:hypothetical protein
VMTEIHWRCQRILFGTWIQFSSPGFQQEM